MAPGPPAARLSNLHLEPWEDREVRHLAWTVSVCALFLAIGLLGLLRPRVHPIPPVSRTQLLPVALFEPSPQPKPAQSAPKPAPSNSSTDPEPIAIQAVAVSPSKAIFAMPLTTTAILVPVHEAFPAMEAAAAEPAQNTAFTPGTGGADTPQPQYPRLAEQRGYEGKVVVNFTVQPSGTVTDVALAKSSGFNVLDEAALSTIRNRWRFPAGGLRHHYVEVIFQLK